MSYLVTGGGWPCALHGRLTSVFAFRANRDIFASPAKAGALLPTGSKEYRLAITPKPIFARALKARTGLPFANNELLCTIILSNLFFNRETQILN